MARSNTFARPTQVGALVMMSAWVAACAGGDGRPEPDGEELATADQALTGEDLGDAIDLGRSGSPPCSEAALRKHHRGPPGHRRNVILMIGDGMQLEDEIAISRYLHGRDFGMTWNRFPYRGYVATWDVTSYNKYAKAAGAPLFDATSYDPLIGYDPSRAGARPYPLEDPVGLLEYLKTGALPLPGSAGWWAATDSASAATAMSTGMKTDDGNVAWLPGDPDDGALLTVGEVLRSQRGMSFGIVSTQPLSAATPAAFSSHNKSRNNAAAIADEIVFSTQPEVVISGGHPVWRPGYSSISKTAYAALASSSTDYLLVERTTGVDGGAALLAGADQAVSEGKKLFGLFGGKGGNFEFGVPADAPGSPSVAPGSTENPTLAQAAEAALEVLSQDRDGFFLMIEQGDIDTANHANNYANKIACAADLDQAVKQVIHFVNRPHDQIHWGNTVLIVVADHATGYQRLNPEQVLGRGDLPTQSCTSAGCAYPDGDVSYGTTGHSNELVRVSVAGRGSPALRQCEGRDYPGTRIIENTALHWFMLDAAGL
jgi:alkaline phosphatase